MKKKLTQRDIAQVYYNCTAAHLSNVLAGRRAISVDFARQAEKVHGLKWHRIYMMTTRQFNVLFKKRFGALLGR